ncbi:MAG: hypothetical protein JXJ22_04515 [Bacteroidales bacterium]|nr:hypothetical protein [Bacteroidales bacterium]
MENKKTEGRLLFGVLVVLVGAALLASNLGFFSYEIRHYIFRWEMILIGIGVITLVNSENRTTGLILIAVGGVFYIRDFYHFNINFWQMFWPGMLIFIGILLIFRRKIDRDHGTMVVDNEDYIDDMAVFGGGDRIITSQNFKGGRITAVFGGSNFNMVKAKLAPGKSTIDVLAVFGGTKLVVPEDWNIKINVVSIFGGFSDKHRISPVNNELNKDKQLILKGFVLFGGGEIKSF